MVELLVVTLSCKKNAHLWPALVKRDIKHHVILCGGADETKLDGKILYIKCNDDYDGLPEKLMYAYEYILHAEQFTSITHILKADDHDTSFTYSDIEQLPIKHYDIFKTHDYFGQVCVYGKCGGTWHFGKVPTTSKWYNREADYDRIPYLAGGGTYILSRKALTYLMQHKDLIETYVYEDAMMGAILNKYNITPYVINYGIKTWGAM